MKKETLLMKFTNILLVLILVLTNCKSSPQTPAPASAQTQPSIPRGVDIWSMLQRGDERARGYFLSEVEVNARDPQGRTPLHYAAENRDYQLAAFFIALGADVNALDDSLQSPLGISVEKNDEMTIGVLVNAKADIHLPIKGNTSAAVIALGKDSSTFKALLTRDSVQTADSTGKTVLHLASIAGNNQAITDVLSVFSNSAYINKRDRANKNALDYAFDRPDSKEHIVIAEKLILSGGISDSRIFGHFAPAVRSANYNLRLNEGLAPIHFAVMNNYSGLISFLLDKKIDINIKSTSGATALHEAVRTGNLRVISLLITNGADVNARDAKGNTPLHIGIPSEVHRDVITILLTNGADPNLRDEHGDTPLHIAIMLNRSLSVVQALLNGTSDVSIRNIQGKTPLYIAVQEKREDLIPVLLSYGSEVFAADNAGTAPFDLASRAGGNVFNLLVTPQTVTQMDSAGNTLLHAAVRNRANTTQITRILNQNAPVDARNRAGDTALHIAVKTNQRETGEFLISRGADIFSVNSAGESPLYLALTSSGGIQTWIINPTTIQAKDGLGNNMLHYAAQWKINNAIPVMLRNDMRIDEPNATGETPLFFAVKADSTSTIRVLLENRANINARDTHGNSVLHAAVRWNARNSAVFLVSNGIDINAFSLNGNTPLHDAVSLGAVEIETLLIKEGANLEARNIDGNTPFMEAVRAGNIPSIERLASNRADISTRNTRGDTPLHIAVGMENLDAVNRLLRYGASIHANNTSNRTPFQIAIGISNQMVSTLLTRDRINLPDDFGNSALHIALQERASEQIIRTIISRGARLNTVDSNGKTPLRLAVDTDQWGAAKILSDAGADPFLAAVDNKSPAVISFEKGEDCIRALFSGRGINAKDSSENTILHFAARYGNPQTINVLLTLGANKSIRNISSEIPYEIALRWNRADNAELLRIASR